MLNLYASLFYIAKLQILNDIHNIAKHIIISTELFYIAKLQILNDIHNEQAQVLFHIQTVLYCKVTNLE